MTKKKVCMVACTEYRSDARVRREAETLVSTGEFEVSFLVLREGETAKSYELEGVKVIELNVKKYRGQNKLSHLMSYLVFFFFAFYNCSRLLFTHSLDVFHAHNMPNFLVFAGILPRLFGKKIVLDIHDLMPEMYCARYDGKYSGFLFNILCLEEALCCGFANSIICTNRVQRDRLIDRGVPARKITVSINSPDPKWFKADISVKNYRLDSHIKLVYHGTIAKRLGIDIAIRAFARLYKENPDMEFHIIGSGEGLAECITLSEELGLSKSVFFSKKMVPVESLPNILKDMHIGIVPIKKNAATETALSVKMLEYIALGIPVIVPRLKTIENYFSDEMVRYFDPGSIDSLVQAITDLCKDETRRKTLAEKAKTFLEQYGWEKCGMDFINLYRNI